MVKLAFLRSSPRDLKELSDLIDQETDHKNNREKLIELWLAEQDLVAEVVNNMVMMLIFNSTRPLRRNILSIFLQSTSPENIEEFINAKKALVMGVLVNSGENADYYVEQYRSILMEHRQITMGKIIQKNFTNDITGPANEPAI